MFTVRDLMQKLSTCNPEDVVILAKDPECNGFFPLDTVDKMIYSPDFKSVYSRKLRNALIAQGCPVEYLYDVVVLWS